jgi:hypothetical protein
MVFQQLLCSHASRYFWLGCNHFPPCNLGVSRGVLLFYTIETGFYVQAIHFLIFHEVRGSAHNTLDSCMIALYFRMFLLTLFVLLTLFSLASS